MGCPRGKRNKPPDIGTPGKLHGSTRWVNNLAPFSSTWMPEESILANFKPSSINHRHQSRINTSINHRHQSRINTSINHRHQTRINSSINHRHQTRINPRTSIRLSSIALLKLNSNRQFLILQAQAPRECRDMREMKQLIALHVSHSSVQYIFT